VSFPRQGRAVCLHWVLLLPRQRVMMLEALKDSNRMTNRLTITRRHSLVIPAQAGIQRHMHCAQVASARGHSASRRRLFVGAGILDSRFRGNDVGGTRAGPARPLIVFKALRVPEEDPGRGGALRAPGGRFTPPVGHLVGGSYSPAEND
jgi:hypothetical protein